MAAAALKILLVDDDDDIREALEELLSDAGHSIMTAGNGRQALDLLATEPLPALILLDVMMPVMDGYEFLHEQRKDARIAAIPVVVLTASRNPDRGRIGEVPVFTKPISLDDLQSYISTLG